MIPVLEKAGMLNSRLFMDRLGIDPWKPILEVADFNSVIALSQEHQVPVYALTRTQADQQGAVWEVTKHNMDLFAEAFAECADKVFALTA